MISNKLTLPVLYFTVVFYASCSWVGVRAPSNIDTTPTFDDAFSVLSSEHIDNKDYKHTIDSLISSFEPPIEYGEKNNLPAGTAFKVELCIINDKYVFKIFHKKNAFKDMGAVNELNFFMYNILAGYNLGLRASYFEMYYNAKEGDIIALDNFLRVRARGHSPGDPDGPQERMEVYKKMREQLVPRVNEFKAKRKILKEKRKEILDELDKISEDNQFKTLVAKGDRAGAADLLKKYLPFEEMAPFEKRFWETYLEVMKNPVPLNQRVLIYRGLNENSIHSGFEGAQELSKEEAIKEGKAFIMSNVLVQKQGSWNKRLRSIEDMNEKFIGVIENSDYTQSAMVSTMFRNHSRQSKESPFLSFTPKISVAQTFGGKQLMSALIDPRLLHYNYAFLHQKELEFLMPLTTFPEDMVGLWTTDDSPNIEEFLENRLKVRITEEFGEARADAIINRIKKNSSDFFSPILPLEPKIPNAPGGTMVNFYKKLEETHGATIKPPMTARGDLSCKDLIKIFWKAP